MDEADITGEKEEFVLLGNLSKSRKPEGPAAVGYCLNCGPDTKLPNGMRWCNADCRNDWETWRNNNV